MNDTTMTDAQLAVQPGPGTELKQLLKRFFIQAHGDCKCNQRTLLMNEQGTDWCDENIDVIVGWLREEASHRNLPFIDAAGRLLVRRAISNARRKERMR
jgi:hypothetical protein